MSKSVSDNISRADRIIAGESIQNGEILGLVQNLKKEQAFGEARRVLEKTRSQACGSDAEERFKRKFTQQLSLCTYKDPDLDPDARLDRALSILKNLDVLDLKSEKCTKDQETLSQTGAIYKRKWELTGQTSYLETSYAYYIYGYNQGVEIDYGYTGINAAFVLDLLALTEANDADRIAKIQRAKSIREDIVAVVSKLDNPNEWWYPVTIAEAYFGLGRYDEAGKWLQEARKLHEVAEWEWETTARQLARLLHLNEKDENQAAIAKQVLVEFLGSRAAGLDALLHGKVGLGLSGGGFRAALFHIGLLARLAELDLLREVEYLSCVSGGSIIGAHFYLEVRNLLQSKEDHEISRQDYIDLVKRIEKDFLDGVQTNIRMQVLSEWLASVKMIYSDEYSRTKRLGELYEDQIFSRVKSLEAGTDGASSSQPMFLLNQLIVQPKGEAKGFSPKYHNWRRAAKVPILVLNATPLNTGHNWQFTTTWMGEPPAGASSEIDANYRLRRMYYYEAPEPHNNMRLGYAVAASSCVPGLFEPLALNGLYEDKIVRLVDGGVHDNQGAAALLEQGCTVLLISDASGQMNAQDQPSKGLLGVPLRANSILQSRIRESQYHDLHARRRSGLLQGLMFIHLKQGLESQSVDWKNCQDTSDTVSRDPLLPYGVQRSVQEKLAAIRTDLDSFSEVEAYSLMTSAYLMTEHALQNSQSMLGFEVKEPATEVDTKEPSAPEWTFLKIKSQMQMPGDETELQKQLKVSDKLALKVWLLSKTLKLIGWAAIAALIGLLAYLSYWFWNSPLSITWGQILTGLVLLALGFTVLKPLVQILQWQKTLQDVLIGLGMVIAGSLLAKLHLNVFDKLFLRQGRLDKLKD